MMRIVEKQRVGMDHVKDRELSTRFNFIGRSNRFAGERPVRNQASA
jgi:hypothetical protein